MNVARAPDNCLRFKAVRASMHASFSHFQKLAVLIRALEAEATQQRRDLIDVEALLVERDGGDSLVAHLSRCLLIAKVRTIISIRLRLPLHPLATSLSRVNLPFSCLPSKTACRP